MNFVRENETSYPKVLVISNNVFSSTTNNGKTLASFFYEFPKENVFQIYFNQENPDSVYFENFFRITDKDILKSTLKKTDKCGDLVKSQQSIKEENVKIKKRQLNSVVVFKKNNLFRIIREIIWSRRKWNTNELHNWIEGISPDIIFFCAGDSGFAHDITMYIKNKWNSKLVVYITDDYILPRKSYSPFWHYRRKYVFNKMKETIQASDLFITISKKMSREYNLLFNKESVQAINMTDSLKEDNIKIEKNSNDISLVYAGGFHFKRYLTLNLLAKSLRRYNSSPDNNKRAYLKIYSGQAPNKKILKYLNVEGVSEFCGELNSVELKRVLNACDIPVHVESFDKKSVSSTLLSISTKIPEYLSLGKPVLAIGPKEVASMEYLQGSAYCITAGDSIDEEVKQLLDNGDLREKIAIQGLIKFESNHLRHIALKKFMNYLMKLYERELN